MVYYNACNPRNEVDTEGSETTIILDYITNFRLAHTTWLKKNKMYLRLVVLQRLVLHGYRYSQYLRLYTGGLLSSKPA